MTEGHNQGPQNNGEPLHSAKRSCSPAAGGGRGSCFSPRVGMEWTHAYAAAREHGASPGTNNFSCCWGRICQGFERGKSGETAQYPWRPWNAVFWVPAVLSSTVWGHPEVQWCIHLLSASYSWILWYMKELTWKHVEAKPQLLLSPDVSFSLVCINPNLLWCFSIRNRKSDLNQLVLTVTVSPSIPQINTGFSSMLICWCCMSALKRKSKAKVEIQF